MIKIEKLKDVENINEIEDLEVRSYVPLREKELMIEELLKVLLKQNGSLYTVNSIDKEIKSHLAVITLYTNIDITNDDYLNYDIIHKNGLYNKIEDKAYHDIINFIDLLELRIDDKLKENTYEKIVDNRLNEMMIVFDETMNHVNKMIDRADPNKITKYITNLIKPLLDKIPDFSKVDILEYIKGKK